MPWVDLIWSTYYNGKIPHASNACGSFWWWEISQLNDIYRGITKIRVGDGSTALFWKVLWLDGILSEQYPQAFSYTKLSDVSVMYFLKIDELQTGFHVPLSAQALHEVREMQAETMRASSTQNTKDQWECIWGQKFSSARFYQFYFRDVEADEAFSWIWKSTCTMKLKVFTWLLLADRVNTKNMLKRKHYNVTDGPECVPYNLKTEETVEHLFFACPFSGECWDKVGVT